MKKIILIIILILVVVVGVGILFYFQGIPTKEAPFVPGKLLPSEAVMEGGAGI